MKKKNQNWLNDPNGKFEDGLHLLQCCCKNRVLLSYLQRKENMPKLRYELGKIGCKVKLVQLPSTPPFTFGYNKPNQLLRSALNGEKTFEEIPNVIVDLYKESIETYRSMRSYHEAMKIAQTAPDRLNCRNSLLSAEQKYKNAWAIIDNWSATGELPIVNSFKSNGNPKSETQVPPSSKTVNAANVALNRDLLSLSSTKDEQKRMIKVESIKKNVEILLSAGIEFKEKRRNTLHELGILNG